MSHQRDREDFILRVVQHAPTPAMGQTRAEYARLMMRHARTYGRIQDKECNEPINAGDRRSEARAEKNLKGYAKLLGVGLKLGGDPRGYTVKVLFPDRSIWNTQGGASEGWGVPGS